MEIVVWKEKVRTFIEQSNRHSPTVSLVECYRGLSLSHLHNVWNDRNQAFNWHSQNERIQRHVYLLDDT